MIGHRPFWIPLAGLLFFAVALAIFYPGFEAPMYYDSLVRLQGNEHLFCRGLLDVVGIFPQRPLPMATFYLNYLITEMSPFYFRVCNAALMALTALSAMILTLLILEAVPPASQTGSRDRKIVAFALGLVFLVHPIQTYVVVYVWQRMALLSCLFYLSALAAYLATRTGRVGNQVLGYSIFSILSICAIASKENALTLPLVLLLAEVGLLRSNWKTIARPIAVCSAAMLIGVAVLFFLERPHGMGEASGFFKTIARYYKESGLTLKEVALSQCRVMFSYIEMIALPFPSNVRLFDAFTISRSITQPPTTLVAVMGVGGYVIAALYLLNRRPVAGFGLMFFFLNLLPEAFLVPQYLFFGYRPSLPMFGLLLAVADVTILLLDRVRNFHSMRRLPAGLALSVLVAVVGLCAVTRTKAELWKNPIDFWADVVTGLSPYDHNVEKHPTVQSLSSLAAELAGKGRHEEALTHINKALELKPRDHHSLLTLAKIQLRTGNLNVARSSYEQAQAANPESAEAMVGIGEVLVLENRRAEALAYFERAIDTSKDNPAAAENIGNALMRAGDPAGAVRFFRRAVQLNPCSAGKQYALGKSLAAVGDISNALIQLQKTIEIEPDHWKAHNDLGVIFARMGAPDKAIAHFEAAVKINPEDVPSRRNLETARGQMGQKKAH